MLLLTRRAGESILIGNDIKITNLRMRGNQCMIGIDAPDEVVIIREELKGKPFKKKNKDEIPLSEYEVTKIGSKDEPSVFTRPSKKKGGV